MTDSLPAPRTVVIDHKLYWAAVGTEGEALYLGAILNSTALGMLVRPFQARGEHNPRDFDKYIWNLPIPLFDDSQRLHRELAALAARAETVASRVELAPGVRFETWRRQIREALASEGIAADLDAAVSELLTSAREFK